MAATVTKYGSDLAHIGRKPEWQVYDVAGVLLTVGSEDGIFRSLPIGTVMLDANICCIVAGTGTGTDVLSLELALAAGDRLVFTGTADNGGLIDLMDRALVVDGSAFPVAEVVDLKAIRTIGSATVDTAASYRVGVLLCRPEYDR